MHVNRVVNCICALIFTFVQIMVMHKEIQYDYVFFITTILLLQLNRFVRLKTLDLSYNKKLCLDSHELHNIRYCNIKCSVLHHVLYVIGTLTILLQEEYRSKLFVPLKHKTTNLSQKKSLRLKKYFMHLRIVEVQAYISQRNCSVLL